VRERGLPGAPADALTKTVEKPGKPGAAADEASVARLTAPLRSPSPGSPRSRTLPANPSA
jgi:hypothetical protein